MIDGRERIWKRKAEAVKRQYLWIEARTSCGKRKGCLAHPYIICIPPFDLCDVEAMHLTSILQGK